MHARFPSPALFLALALFVSIGLAAAPSNAVIRIVASTNDLGSIASSVGGSEVEVVAISRANADPHRVEVLPSYMVRVSKARLYLKVGLGLDQWADQIVDGSHNGKVIVVDCSKDIPVLEKPTATVNASMGDIHPNGNPHYWLDPRNGAIVARTIAAELSRIDPAHASEYAQRAESFAQEAEREAAKGAQIAEKLRIRDIITYHRSWSYFANAFGLDVVATVEPIPGIPPTGRHLNDLVNQIRERKIPLLLEEPYFSEEAGEFLARETAIRVARVSAACDDVVAGSYLAHFDSLLDILSGLSDGAGSSGSR
jgi:zinc/manganese transport system substrate-binding protein